MLKCSFSRIFYYFEPSPSPPQKKTKNKNRKNRETYIQCIISEHTLAHRLFKFRKKKEMNVSESFDLKKILVAKDIHELIRQKKINGEYKENDTFFLNLLHTLLISI